MRTNFTYLLHSYFRSGWAFLFPYLAAYLLYASLDWHVNPFSSEPQSSATSLLLPSLLHVYWFLHALHLVLGAIALVTWWRSNTPQQGGNCEKCAQSYRSALQPFSLSAFQKTAPWLCLALLFWIPGFYLEWPSDPWEHLRRINEWHSHSIVTEHSAWNKSSYFLPYSLTGHLNGSAQQKWLNIYYTGICLLLCWQYYRLACIVGLNKRTAFTFVILNILTFGNNLFSFSRYYGLSSSIVAQLSAVALIRIAVTVAYPRNGERAVQLSETRSRAPASQIYCLLPHIIAALAVLMMVGWNHIQGVGVAGLGILGVTIWRLIHWKRSMMAWLALAFFLLSIAAVLWFPRHTSLDEVYRPQGWLTALYGFDLLSSASPAFQRSVNILGMLGILNLMLGLWLACRNHLAGWLTVTPIIALCLPGIAIPLASSLADRNVTDILTFHRMLFAIPSGLAICFCLGPAVFVRLSTCAARPWLPGGALVAAMAALASLSPGWPTHNRLWNLVAVTPHDLRLHPTIEVADFVANHLRNLDDFWLIAPDSVGLALHATMPTQYPMRERVIGKPVAATTAKVVTQISSSVPTRYGEKPLLNRDPLAANRAAWVGLLGISPEFLSGLQDFRSSSTALQNSVGEFSGAMTSDLIAIDPAKVYRLETSIRQLNETPAKVYLAVAWYDRFGRLLDSNISTPVGAGFPIGWENGTFSYYGLVGVTTPTRWTMCRTTFGFGASSMIPPHAKYVRIGALLNFNQTPGAVVQMTNIQLWEKTAEEEDQDGVFPQYSEAIIVGNSSYTLFSHSSYASKLSNHWSPQEVANELSGSQEIERAARATGARTINLTTINERPRKKAHN